MPSPFSLESSPQTRADVAGELLSFEWLTSTVKTLKLGMMIGVSRTLTLPAKNVAGLHGWRIGIAVSLCFAGRGWIGYREACIINNGREPSKGIPGKGRESCRGTAAAAVVRSGGWGRLLAFIQRVGSHGPRSHACGRTTATAFVHLPSN